ncbi:MAG: hypothetical protein GX847_03150 [Clostridiales bacterium]|nr:hypothetical protein [Clostridiales bacterium]
MEEARDRELQHGRPAPRAGGQNPTYHAKRGIIGVTVLKAASVMVRATEKPVNLEFR